MHKTNRNEIYDKNINFLIGSGASVGLLPTLSLAIKNTENDEQHSIETLAAKYHDKKCIRAHIFSKYLTDVIKPAASFKIEDINPFDNEKQEVVENYKIFISNIVSLLQKKKHRKIANIFTTNYDGMFAHVAEELLRKKSIDFVLNDGGTGFIKRNLDVKNFNRYFRHQGIFDRYSQDVVQLNLMQPHGSVYWYKDAENIEISYDLIKSVERLDNIPVLYNDDFINIINDPEKNDNDINFDIFNDHDDDLIEFWEKYDKLPIVNPTKWKFHETVFEEHYYQMLRYLSYELEKENTVFIVFGFSFADEHILNLFKRSLSNPSLKVYICCYNEKQKNNIKEKFKKYSNIEYICVNGDLNFTAFNKEVFNPSGEEYEH